MCTATATSTLFAAAAGLAVVASLGADAAPLSSRGGARKILCLHGGGGDGPSFDYGLTDLQAALPSSAGYEFVFPSAPDGGLWLRDPPNGKGQPTTDPNWGSESLAMLDNIVSSQGPFYGILGYSQGSAFVSAYLAHAPANTFQVAAMFAGYLPTTHLGVLGPINAASPFNNIPAVVFMGGTDYVITNDMTREQASVYTNPLVLRSTCGGHIVPSRSDPTFDRVVAFIQDPSSVERTAISNTACANGGGKGTGKGDAGKGGWEQQADGTWVNTATGQTYGGKGADSKGTDGKTDGGAKDQAVNDDDDVKDYADEEYAEAKADEWEQQADGSWVNTATGQTYGAEKKESASGKGVKDVANKDAYGNEKEVLSNGKTDAVAQDQAVNDDDDVKDYAEEEYAEAKAEEWEQQADGSWVNIATGQTYAVEQDGEGKEGASYGKTDGGAKDQAVNDDDDVKDYAEEEYAEAKEDEWEQQADGSWVNTVTGQTYGDASKATQTKLEYIGSSSASSFSSNVAAAAVFGLVALLY